MNRLNDTCVYNFFLFQNRISDMTDNPEPKKKEKITRCPIEIEVTDDVTKKR